MYVHLAQCIYGQQSTDWAFNDSLLMCVWREGGAWKPCYVYTVEVQTPVYNLCYINRLEVLIKILCQIRLKQRLFVSS